MTLPDPEAALTAMRGQVADTPESLPPTTTIELDITDQRGKRYVGKFLYHVPTLGQQVEIGRLKTQYLPQGSPADMNAATIVEVTAYLTVCIEFNDAYPKPAWWNPLQAYSMEPYSALFGRCLAYEAKFHGESSVDRGDERAPEQEGPSVGSDPVRVERQIQPPPKRRETLAGDGA